VVTLIELAHGAARADTTERKSKREKFIEELLIAMPVYPVTVSMALRAGHLDGQNQARGVRVPLPDLLVGVAALELGYAVATSNLRHFREVTGLSVIQL
jgi:predicted nucleic acid-binding protein